ncbi:NAD(P)/FAD-dependent oxidoreductase [Persicitalea jodogahamensis]|uniref:D-amino-acid dehydrogenase n=1 Tax=Persicitalea jodogahamensis TaxID=402147 RepID=A0A8J3D3S3_9BACT|nr:FAD-dependent oxidoreductase [Persicitalea jodogahamensis]GHB77838.1 D-amino-acid dehydrogenase [Persicitalea jodogahamensis]
MKSVGIVGGGVSGLFSAYYLLQEGCEVTIIERGNFADGCSFGNAGMIVPSHIIPLAQPGMIAKGMRWMLDAQSPFYVKPRISSALVKWGYLFWKKSTEKHVHYAIPHLRDLSLLSKELYQELASQDDFAFGWEEKGLLMLFKNPGTRHEMEEEAAVANRSGIEARLLSGKETQALEPHVQLTVEGSVFYPGDAHIYPNQLIAGLVSYLKKSGVRFLEDNVVEDFEIQNEKVKSVKTDSGSYSFDEFVIAAGAWSPILTQKLGISLSLQGGKGYSFLAEGLETKMQIPAIMLEARTTATPMGGGVRFAGTLEIAGTDETINMNRVRGIHHSIRQYYPDLEVDFPEEEKVWSGLRPCSPDGLPYIGRVKNFNNLTLATGHGMMGLSLGPATGKLVADTIAGNKASVGVEAFAPGRFN